MLTSYSYNNATHDVTLHPVHTHCSTSLNTLLLIYITVCSTQTHYAVVSAAHIRSQDAELYAWPYECLLIMLNNITTYTYYTEWLSEYILNDTSAPLGYTLPFTLDILEKVHKLKIRTEHKLNTTQQCKIQQNKTTLVRSPFYDTRPGNQVGLSYNVLKPT